MAERNLCNPHIAAMDIAYNSTDPEHMQARIESELNRWKQALADQRAEARTPPTERGHQDGLEEAAGIAHAVATDALDKLGYVAGNIAFENGRSKAAMEIEDAIRSLAEKEDAAKKRLG